MGKVLFCWNSLHARRSLLTLVSGTVLLFGAQGIQHAPCILETSSSCGVGCAKLGVLGGGARVAVGGVVRFSLMLSFEEAMSLPCRRGDCNVIDNGGSDAVPVMDSKSVLNKPHIN
ncbi:hypothetical protein L1987_45662 [Smallanthus sonchifolius]|uniref:Uncharacterized protein n=1 Tax=Smallanthus sonchifolius TaxID=185202 RepID=A0ACB9FXD8_9ASTR|nr:hypothetical protein L1987_45662 [Smallanthus sonchifolius]